MSESCVTYSLVAAHKSTGNQVSQTVSDRASRATVKRALPALFSLFAAVCGAAVSSPPTQAEAPAGAPTVNVVTLPDFWGAYAIWGASGTDRRGRIFLGIASNDDESGSAHLLEYDPVANRAVDRGNVVAELKRSGFGRPGEKQMKIHSRIVQAADGHLYFASMDETGEEPDGSKLPVWGGHLWRLAPDGIGWEHLARTPEALIAIASGGRFVYALGYFDHVLYQFDTRSRKLKSSRVGSVGGHISRNFFADDRGHVYVPRLTAGGGGAQAPVNVTLVELSPDLKELHSQPLPEYLERAPDDSHGIVAVHPDRAGGWYFATGKGRLFHLEPRPSAPAVLVDLGWYHPEGPRYVASMFRDGRSGRLYGAAEVPRSGARRYEWVSREPGGKSTVTPLPYGKAAQFPHACLLYGSMTRDAVGRFYVVGTMNYKPVVLQITPAAPDAVRGNGK
jgi:hypothetical protein